MKIYLISQTDTTESWDIYTDFVIAADFEEEALQIAVDEGGDDWDAENVILSELGLANYDIEKGVILECFKAG